MTFKLFWQRVHLYFKAFSKQVIVGMFCMYWIPHSCRSKIPYRHLYLCLWVNKCCRKSSVYLTHTMFYTVGWLCSSICPAPILLHVHGCWTKKCIYTVFDVNLNKSASCIRYQIQELLCIFFNSFILLIKLIYIFLFNTLKLYCSKSIPELK